MPDTDELQELCQLPPVDLPGGFAVLVNNARWHNDIKQARLRFRYGGQKG